MIFGIPNQHVQNIIPSNELNINIKTNYVDVVNGKTATVSCLIYNKGFNDALDYAALLDLELNLKGESKNWKEKQDILRKRFNISTTDKEK
jgi:hypothetical protein